METRIDTLTETPAQAPGESPAAKFVRARVGSLTVVPAAAETVRRNPMRALRLPEQDDPVPGSTRMLGLSAWAALLVFVGMVVAIRVFVAIVFEPGPSWLVPTVMSVGIAGTVCGGLAFATVHHRWLPWELLGVASLLLGGNLLLVITQL
ncbi:hypothetical protein AB0M47_39790 [Hamadaea sp. NPDC051192]|uniref:hypothetical protein n=1 Tax=Hamadaea sp. NPDC051192 TaxID=3154940 RepID=UPI00341BD6CA